VATVSTVATFQPEYNLWQLPMKPDNTPVNPVAPIGMIEWPSAVVVPAKITTNVTELAITFVFPTNISLRFNSLAFSLLATASGSVQADINDVADIALVTITHVVSGVTLNTQVTLEKNSAAQKFTVTNSFSAEVFTPRDVQWQRVYDQVSALIFRSTNETANAAAAITYQSYVQAFAFTVEQSSQGYIHTSMPVLTN